MALYFQLFWLPTVTSAALLALLWSHGARSGSAPWLIGWFLLALAAQYLGTPTSLWIGGLVLQTSLAIFLLVKWQLDLTQ
jgi:hypothetical protein